MRFLIAGFGSIGRRHFRNLRALGERDLLFYRTGLSQLSNEELVGVPVETDLEAALAHKPDAVIVANPTALHLDVAIPAAQAGCHLLLEKPLSHNLERVIELEKAVKTRGSRVLMGFQYRFHPGLQKASELIAQGELGRPLSARAQREAVRCVDAPPGKGGSVAPGGARAPGHPARAGWWDRWK